MLFERFGELGSAKEINELAENLLNEGDVESLKAMAKENGISEDYVELYLTGEIPALCDPLTAAMEIAPAQKSDETKENQGVPEKEEEQKQVPGQTELTRDSPEYCPTQTRKAYIDNLTTADAAVYISHGLNVVILAYPEKVQKWLEQEVDSKGEAIEK